MHLKVQTSSFNSPQPHSNNKSPTSYLRLNLNPQSATNYSQLQRKRHKQPIITLNILLANHQNSKIELHQNSDPLEEAQKFVKINKLNKQMVQVIAHSIRKQLDAYQEMSLCQINTQSFVTKTPEKKKHKIFNQDDTQNEIDYLNNLKRLKQDVIRLQKLSDNKTNRSKSPILKKSNTSPHKSPFKQNQTTITDKIVMKRLFNLLDGDMDGLVALENANFTRVNKQINMQLMNIFKDHASHIHFEFKDFYKIVSKDQDQYFVLLKDTSEFMKMKQVKFVLNR